MTGTLVIIKSKEKIFELFSAFSKRKAPWEWISIYLGDYRMANDLCDSLLKYISSNFVLLITRVGYTLTISGFRAGFTNTTMSPIYYPYLEEGV